MGNSKSALPYDIGDVVCSLKGPVGWVLHEGKRSRDGEPVSVFRFDKKATSAVQAALAENFVKKLKTLRHPHILAYSDGLESDNETCIVTESVVPLSMWLEQQREAGESPENLLASIGWGMGSLLQAVAFINDDCKLCHGAISTHNILVTKGGDWKLGGLFVIGEMGGAMGPSQLFRQTPDVVANKYKSPERLEHRSQMFTATGIDMWAVGAVLHEAINGPAGDSDDLSAPGSKIPRQLHKFHSLLMAHAPSDRPGAKKMMTHAGFRFLCNTPLYQSLKFLEEWQLKTDPERVSFLNELNGTLDSFPKAVNCYKVLLALRDAISPPSVPGAPGSSRPSAGSNIAPNPLTAVVLEPFLKITGIMRDSCDFQRLVIPTVVWLFASPDRATRMALLRHLNGIVEHVDDKLLNGQVFKSICSGFSDNAPQMREQTVKSIVLLAPKLDTKNLNQTLLRNLVLLLKDPEPAIRTNTLICLSKIIVHFNDETKKKVALGSFPQGVRDKFVPARLAALRGMSASMSYVENDDQALAGKVIPGITFALVDPSPDVRALAFGLMQKTVDRLKETSDKRLVAQKKEEEAAKQRSLEQCRVGEIGGQPDNGNAYPSNKPVQPGQDGSSGYFTAAAGWAGSMWTRSSNTRGDTATNGTYTAATNPSTAAVSKFSPVTDSPAPSPSPSLPLREGSAGPGKRMVLTPAKKTTLNVNMDDDGFGEGWENDDDFNAVLSGDGNDGWGDADNDLLTGDSVITTTELGARKKSFGHVAPTASGPNDFFSSMASKPTGNKFSANLATRKAEAARKSEEVRKRIAERKEMKKKPAVIRKASTGADDWDNW